MLNLQLTDIERLRKHVSFHKAIYKAIKSRDLECAIEETEKHMLEAAHQYSGTIHK